MRLTIRNEQFEISEAVAQESFVRRLAAHLRREYARSPITLPTGEVFAVEELPTDKLYELVRVAIQKARQFEMTFESAISGFAAIMFDVAPNFDEHRLCQVLLHDEETEPNRRIEELAAVLSDQNWEAIRKDYDPAAWVLPEKPAEEESPATETPSTTTDSAEFDPLATVIVR